MQKSLSWWGHLLYKDTVFTYHIRTDKSSRLPNQKHPLAAPQPKSTFLFP